MGTVYLALAHGPGGFNKLKVVKVLNADLAGEPQFLKMFLNEARLAARLNHANIVRDGLEVGARGEDYFIEMEYLDGQSYSAFTRRAEKSPGRLTLDMHVWVLTQVLTGLHYAHELRGSKNEPLEIVHRDISPHNVSITYDGTVKVLDFGIAKAADSRRPTRPLRCREGAVATWTWLMEQSAVKPLDRRTGDLRRRDHALGGGDRCGGCGRGSTRSRSS